MKGNGCRRGLRGYARRDLDRLFEEQNEAIAALRREIDAVRTSREEQDDAPAEAAAGEAEQIRTSARLQAACLVQQARREAEAEVREAALEAESARRELLEKKEQALCAMAASLRRRRG